MGGTATAAPHAAAPADGLKAFYTSKTDALELACRDKATNLRRLEAQRNELNSKGVLRGERVGVCVPGARECMSEWGAP